MDTFELVIIDDAGNRRDTRIVADLIRREHEFEVYLKDDDILLVYELNASRAYPLSGPEDLRKRLDDNAYSAAMAKIDEAKRARAEL